MSLNLHEKLILLTGKEKIKIGDNVVTFIEDSERENPILIFKNINS